MSNARNLADLSVSVTNDGSVTANALTYTGALTGSTGVLNIGSGQIYKDASGRLGIGVTSPGQTISVAAPNTAQALGIWNRTLDNVYGGIYFKTSDGATDQCIILNERSGTNGSNLLIYTKPDGGSTAEAIRINSSGRLGVGTTSPQFLVSANQNSSSGAPSVQVTPQFYAKGYAGASQQYAGIGFAMYEHTNGYWGSGILARDDTGSYGSALAFYTSTGSATPTPTERMRIDSSGRVTKSYQPAFLAYSSGFSITGGAWGTVSNNLTSVSYNVGSNYNTTTGRFTAPVAGKYFFYASGWTSGSTSGERYGICANVNGGPYNFISGGNYCLIDSPITTYAVCLDLNVNDYVMLSVFSAITCTWGGSSHKLYFGGYLLG